MRIRSPKLPLACAPLVLALLLAMWTLPGCGEKQPGGEQTAAIANAPSILLIVLDTVRADHLSCYGHTRATTPNIDRLAARGVRFERFYSNSSWTLSSHASLFTGLYPVAHQATQETLVLGDGPPTLAAILTRRGYETFGSSGNPTVSVESGLARGFSTFREAFRHARRKPEHRNNTNLRRFLASCPPDRPFFAFINYIDAHAPYAPLPEYRSRFFDSPPRPERLERCMKTMMPDYYLGRTEPWQYDMISRLYDGDVAYVDDQVKGLVDILETGGRLDNTVIIITSDHGEAFGENGHLGHSFNVYNALLHVPLIVVFPDGRYGAEVRTDVAQLLDLFPTILAQCGITYDERYDGRDLFAEDAESVQVPAMAEYYYPRQVLSLFDEKELKEHMGVFVPFMRRLRALQDGRMKLIWGSNGLHEFYRIDEDPNERINLAAEESARDDMEAMLTQLEQLVETHMGETPLPPAPPVGWMAPGYEEAIQDPELLEKLRALGYIR